MCIRDSIKLLPAKSTFALISTALDKYDFRIEECMLEVNRIEVRDLVTAGHKKDY